jgi:K+-transporting ATPase ATPase B chain
VRDLGDRRGGQRLPGQIVLWLWFTVLFANFAEAVAEGRGKAQADTCARTRSETMAKRAARRRRPRPFRASRRPAELKVGEWCWSKPATSDPRRRRGHRRASPRSTKRHHRRIRAGDPRIRRRPLGRHRRHAVLSDWIKVRITAKRDRASSTA